MKLEFATNILALLCSEESQFPNGRLSRTSRGAQIIRFAVCCLAKYIALVEGRVDKPQMTRSRA